jgi:hypothetical protein
LDRGDAWFFGSYGKEINEKGVGMKKKLQISLAIVLIATMVGVFGCGPAAGPALPEELQPCGVELVCITNEWSGEETVALDTSVVITNPNPIEITLDSFDYTLALSDEGVDLKTTMPGLHIPANDAAALMYVSVIDFSGTLAIPKYLGGMDYVSAHVASVPTWKLLGGKKPPFWSYPAIGVLATIKGGATLEEIKAAGAHPETIPAMLGELGKLRGTVDAVQGAVDATWAAAPDGPAQFVVEGTAIIGGVIGTSEGPVRTTLEVPFKLQYTR